MGEKRELSFPSTLVLIAALNEEEGIGTSITELKQHLRNPQFLVVDGKSKDKTVHIAKGLDVDVVYQEGKGKGDALAYAFGRVNANVDYVVLTDADYTYPAVFIPQMMKILEENPHVGMVCGNRFNSHFDLKAMRNVFYFGNRILAFAANVLDGVNMRDPLTGLRVVRWNVLKDWKPKSKGFDVEVELNHRVGNMGYRIVEISIPYRTRLGAKKLRMRDSFQHI